MMWLIDLVAKEVSLPVRAATGIAAYVVLLAFVYSLKKPA